jgi:hypothetical protein
MVFAVMGQVFSLTLESLPREFRGQHAGDGQVVRVFRQDAPFQEKVLDEFQAQHWAAKIANPLPRNARINRKRHLKEVVARLNDKQVPALLRFHAEGAQAVRWEPQ